MGVTKDQIHDEKLNSLAASLKALAHPARLAIVEQLTSEQTCVCGELVDDIGLAQATVSQHLRELKNAGIIKGNVNGTSVCYCFDPDKLVELRKELLSLFDDAIAASKVCC